ncbi:hypothetical protein AB0C04_29425 [Micromonospora sp. NPDC048909]|uniref:hypothetical protein n=1 Tax=Micromonospora sp. NPDC048909 TaxID=3155643 RepID=UPI0034110FE9
MVGTIARHVAGAVVAWLTFTLEGLVGYLALLAYALATNSDPGGPLAGPVFVLIAAVLGAVAVPLLVVPAVVVGEVAARTGGRVRRIVTACAAAMVLAALCAVVIALATDVSAGGTVLAGAVGALAVAGPVAAHSVTAEGGRLLARVLVRRRNAVPAAPGPAPGLPS